ncbi:hypothetical protein B4W74_07590 [Staphylococcus intermedius]|uniref:Uncharacterized protein n=2 Tax=Staphylococcus intermedius TaxID=1285 RepID=A0A380G470_STAIN|nr:hypothetical protein B5C04_07240 [Staphylococcus intermedius]PNZ55499.1 hypothetical protein CD138_00145 [Staphylococcus intermedius NCTC 11048]PCF78481.1 hypothetical protein B4W74_07590 [Staphylococcus intermedius]PCF79455.1 hypothetical protein B4W70_07230 [Staphylococcus intermedius]PCF86809.1 hypothetical protein B4W76_07075 [Staphylococcus intermedius]
MMIKMLQNYFITVSIFFMMLVLSVGFLMNFPNGFTLLLSLTVILTMINFSIETWLLRATLPERKVRFIQTLVFPLSIIIIGVVCFILLPTMS